MPAAKKPSIAVKTPARAPTKAVAKAVAKPVAKPAAKPAAKPVAKPVASAPAAKAVTVVKAEKPEKAKKPKLVRDSFTIPKAEYLVLDELKQRSNKLAHPVKKSELLRAGIKALAAMPDIGFLAAVQAVPAIKTGRPTTAPAA
ncbi:MAG TPA: hypothetical protein VLJ57_17875 [Burkholderiaceae bacterium]|nr:hypothetical protein [Burkholderiaceae bacterium]